MRTDKLLEIEWHQDEVLFSFRRGDVIVVDPSTQIRPNSTVIVKSQEVFHVRRYEFIDGKASLWPKTEGEVVGQAVELVRRL